MTPCNLGAGGPCRGAAWINLKNINVLDTCHFYTMYICPSVLPKSNAHNKIKVEKGSSKSICCSEYLMVNRFWEECASLHFVAFTVTPVRGANTKSWLHEHQNIYLLGHFINQRSKKAIKTISGKSHKPPLKECKMPWDCQCTRYHVVAVQSLARSKGLEVSRKNLQPSLKRT